MLDDQDLLPALKRHWNYAGKDEDISHEIYHDNAVLEFPQSGERFEGVENFREWRRQHPAHLLAHPADHPPRRPRGGGKPHQLRRRAMDVFRQPARVPGRQSRARAHLHHARLGSGRVARTLAGQHTRGSTHRPRRRAASSCTETCEPFANPRPA